jgi:hypothetical protein
MASANINVSVTDANYNGNGNGSVAVSPRSALIRLPTSSHDDPTLLFEIVAKLGEGYTTFVPLSLTHSPTHHNVNIKGPPLLNCLIDHMEVCLRASISVMVRLLLLK